MKLALRLVLVMALACVAPAVWAADLTGVWKGTFNFNDADVPTTLNLKVSGTDVTGTVEGLPTSPVDIHEGKVVGDLISFWVNTDYQGETYKLIFKGAIKGEQIDFAFGTEDGSWGTNLSVKRGDVPVAVPAVADATGTWKGSFDLMGTDTPVTFSLKSSGGVVTGTVTNSSGTATEIHDGKIEGDTVSFWITTEYQGNTYQLQYKGKIAAGQIEFTFGVPDGSWSSAVTAKKS